MTIRSNMALSFVDKKETEFLVFMKMKDKNKKTYDVYVSNKGHQELGVIKWRAGWRKYVFQAIVPDLVFDYKCGKDIIEYLKLIMEEHKNKK